MVLPFNKALAAMSALDFFERILVRELKAVETVIGHDFAFGHGREGSGDWLRGRIPTQVVEAVDVEEVRVSSSLIRDLVSQGEVGKAATYLGRAFALDGVVVAGQKLGRTLGYPTINLARSQAQVLPLDGVYVGEARIAGETYRAATSVGLRPTVPGAKGRTIEAYLIDYQGKALYGSAVRLEFWRRLRGEEKFESLEELAAQMKADVDLAREVDPGPLESTTDTPS